MESTAKKAHLWKRDEHEFYIEPERCTTQLCAVERFVGAIHDPSCGQGNIVRALTAQRYDAFGSDIVERVPGALWFTVVQDFLADDYRGFAPNCVMNPPFGKGKLLEAFIRKALERFPGKVCVFADVKFLASSGRANGIYATNPPNRVWIITPRPSCPPGRVLMDGGKASGGTADWMWMVWDRTAPHTGTTMGWLTSAHLEAMKGEA